MARDTRVEILGALNGLLRSRVRVETSEGVIRTGILSGIVKSEIGVGDAVALLPTEISLDHDTTDAIAVHRIKTIRRVERASN